MSTPTDTRRTNYRLLSRIRLLVLTIITLSATAFAQGSHQQQSYGFAPASEPATGRLSADASYIAVTDAIKRAKAEGASGDLLKIDLEWDDVRSVVTWDLTFSSGTEYELDATTGKLLGAKPKAPAKLALLAPLVLDGAAKDLFQEIIKKAEKSQGQPVLEMELKRIKARSQTIFEVSLTNGTTVYYDAVTGEAIANI